MRTIHRTHFRYEQTLWSRGYRTVVGLDEVGRGAWAGPVVVGAVMFPAAFSGEIELADSKLLRHTERVELTEQIKKIAVWRIVSIPVNVINREGIGRATQRAFRKAIRSFPETPDFLLVDAFFIRYIPKGKQKPITKGDRVCSSIAAAAIIAKVHRDLFMRRVDRQFPAYGFGQHKGYGTRAHQQAIAQHGFCRHHRTRYNLEPTISRWRTKI